MQKVQKIVKMKRKRCYPTFSKHRPAVPAVNLLLRGLKGESVSHPLYYVSSKLWPSSFDSS